MSSASTSSLLTHPRIGHGMGSRLLPGTFLALILVLAFWMRWTGMDWGLPQGEHLVSTYRSDERTLLTWIRQMQPEIGDFNPHSYFNGTLLLFLLSGIYKILSLWGLLTIGRGPLFYYEHVAEWAKFFWFGRLTMVFIAVATVWVVYQAGRLAFGRRVGLLAALLYALVPLHVVSSKHLLVEPAATLWFAGMLYFCFKVIQEGEWRDYLSAALVLASACVVKITSAPLWLVFLLAHFLSSAEKRKLLSKKFWTASAAAAGFYFLLNPYLLFNLQEAWPEAGSYFNHYQKGWSGFGYGPLFSVTHLLPYGFGLWLMGWGIAATLFGFFSRRREVWLTLFGLLVYFYSNARTGTVIVKYHVVLLPFLTLLVAYFFGELMKQRSLLVRGSAAVLFVWMIFETGALSVAYNRLFVRPDARDRASRWIQDFIPKDSKIAILQEPYWYSPPILYNQYFFLGQNRYYRTEEKYQVVNLEYQEKKIKTEKPAYVVITNREVRLFQREQHDFRKTDDWSYLESFLREEGYKKVQTFENRLEGWGVKPPREFPPDDWQQILVEIRIYQRVGASH